VLGEIRCDAACAAASANFDSDGTSDGMAPALDSHQSWPIGGLSQPKVGGGSKQSKLLPGAKEHIRRRAIEAKRAARAHAKQQKARQNSPAGQHYGVGML
jgi:hypothetical protein